jgi:hypothetical protein
MSYSSIDKMDRRLGRNGQQTRGQVRVRH